MRTSTTILIALVMQITLSHATDYCRMSGCIHTACIYPNTSSSARCTSYQGSGLTDDNKRRIVDLHNQFRQKVASGQEVRGYPGPQPAAVSMPNLEWDDEIASIAQIWANQCALGHDKCRNVDRFAVGQNIAITSNTGDPNTIIESLVQMWYDEVKYFSGDRVSHLYRFESTTSSYTQMVWAKTTKIGCGANKFKKDNFDIFFLVCNYGPAGNWPGGQIYQIK